MQKVKAFMGANKLYISGIIVTLILVVFGSFFYSHRIPRSQSTNNNYKKAGLSSDAKNTRGPQTATVKIVEFSDLECLACAQGHIKLNKVITKYQDQIQLIYRHYPLKSHKNSNPAANAAEAAGEQGKFFQMIDLLYKNQNNWANKTDPTNMFATYADELNLNIEKFMKDYAKTWTNISLDRAMGEKVNIKLTPTFFINDKMFEGVMSETELETEIQQYLKTPEATNTSEILDQ